jgi:hypothetical protein
MRRALVRFGTPLALVAACAVVGSARELASPDPGRPIAWRAPARLPSVELAAREGAAELVGMGDDTSPVAWDATRGIWWSEDARPHWWQSALALDTLVRYLERSDDTSPVYQYVIQQTYARNVVTPHAAASTNFVNRYLDDTAWWGITWSDAARYELQYRHDPGDAGTFLRLAEWDARSVATAPRRCGGISWRIGSPPDTIANAEYAALAGGLFGLRQAGVFANPQLAAHWLHEARATLGWLSATGLIDLRSGKVFDRLGTRCDQLVGWPITYTEGEVAEAFTLLGSGLNSRAYLQEAARFLRYATSPAAHLTRAGLLQERCEGLPGRCERVPDPLNLPAFKGVLMQAMADWASATGSSAFRTFVLAQTHAILANSTSDGAGHPGDCSTPHTCQFGFHWALPLMDVPSRIGLSAATQASAIAALTAALRPRGPAAT